MIKRKYVERLKVALFSLNMEYEELIYKFKNYTWSSSQDSQHPDFVLVCDKGEIWVQVEISPEMENHNELWFQQKVKYPISMGTVERIISQILEQNHIEGYFKSDYGLTLRETGELVES